jgi:hypothetical protein
MTPLQLNVIAGMLNNVGIRANVAGLNAISTYESLPVITSFIAAVNKAESIRFDPFLRPNVQTTITSNTLAKMKSLGAGDCPALGDSIPANLNLNLEQQQIVNEAVFPPGLSGYAKFTANNIASPTDLTKFCQIFSSAYDFRSATNQTINSADTTNTYLGPTFTNMTNLITGDVSSVTRDRITFGNDLKKLGQLINTQTLDLLGTPASIIAQLVRIGGLPPGLGTQLTLVGVSSDIINQLKRRDYSIADSVQAAMYQAMKNTTGEPLTNVLDILDVTTPGIQNLADLLNPQKIFPTSYLSLTAGIFFELVYLNSSGSVNTNLITQLPSYYITADSPGYPYERLKTIIPHDQALANKALQSGLSQLKGIENTVLPALGDVCITLKELNGLPLVQTSTQPVANGVVDVIRTALADGSGTSGTLTMFDVIGSAAGFQITAPITNVYTSINSTNTNNVKEVYNVMTGVMNGQYNTVSNIGNVWNGISTPYGNFPPNFNVAVSSLCDTANTQIAIYITTNKAKANVINDNYFAFARQLSKQINNLNKAGILIAGIPGNVQSSIFSWAQSLADYGTENEPGGPVDYLTYVVDIPTFTGQSILAACREGDNTRKLEEIGIMLNNSIPT